MPSVQNLVEEVKHQLNQVYAYTQLALFSALLACSPLRAEETWQWSWFLTVISGNRHMGDAAC